MGVGRVLRGIRAPERFLAWNRLEVAPESLFISSSAFDDGGAMAPSSAGIGVGDNRSPPLTLAGVPKGTAALILILQDPDVPLLRPVVHLIVALAPETRALAEGGLNADAGLVFGRGSFGRQGYAGPRPLCGHGPHRYIFQLFASRVPVPAGAKLPAILAALRGNCLARGRLTGTYERF